VLRCRCGRFSLLFGQLSVVWGFLG
jgi:hypothetical protein